MPFIRREDIDPKLLSSADQAYREQLRVALSSPGLPGDQREALRRQLQQVGKPRVYDANSPPLPGAIQFGSE